MGKGTFAVLLLIVLVELALVIFIRGVEAEGNEEVKKLGLSFVATVILVTFVFFLALYLANRRTRRLYIIT